MKDKMSVGRLNSSTDIIPIQGPSGRHDYRVRTNFRPRPFSRHTYFVDQLIVPRVKQYLEEHKDSVYVDINCMVDDLQRRYRDYTRRNRGAFKKTVEKAFSVVLQQYGVGDTYSFDDSGGQQSDSSDEEVGGSSSASLQVLENNTSAQLTNMYLNRPVRRPGGSGDADKELINISSDEDDTKKERDMGESSRDVKDTPGPIGARARPSNPGPSPAAQTSTPYLVNGQAAKLYRPAGVTSTPQSTDTPVRNTNPPSRGAQRVSTSSPVLGKNRLKKRKTRSPNDSPVFKRKRDVPFQEPKVTFSDMGGIDSVLEEVNRLLVHLRHPEVYQQLGVPPPRGFLLHGPPGCGKSLLAHAIAGELGLPLLKVAAPELVGGVSGESEERVRELFQQAVEMQPSVLFLDEVDAIAPHRGTAQREMERRIVAQLLACMDDLGRGDDGGADVLVLGATNRPDALDPALRRAGRFDREVCLGIPDRAARESILQVLCSPLRVEPTFDFKWAAARTPGFVGADLSSLTREAALSAITRTFSELERGPSNLAKNITIPDVVQDAKRPKRCPSPDKAEVIEIVDRDTPQSDVKKPVSVEEPSTSSSASEVKTDTLNKAKDEVEEDEVRFEAEVSSSAGMEVDEVEKEEKATGSDSAGGQDVEVISQVMRPVSWLVPLLPLTEAQLQQLFITQRDFEDALKRVQPSAKREGFVTVPDVTWSSVGALHHIREELQMAILAPVQHPEAFEVLGLSAPTGLLLVGPPGCGKTLLAKAVANEAGINFISVKGPELLNMYVGESEKAVRQCFQRARNSAPCVIFFDELDALCPRRSGELEGSHATSRVVNQMLTEMDGIEGRRGVFLLAASNRPDIIDPAVLRPGRLDKILYVGLPDPDDRVEILQALTKGGTRPKLAADVDMAALGRSPKLERYTGADLAALVREAAILALRELMTSKGAISDAEACVAKRHLDAAIDRIRPSVNAKDMRRYEELRRIYAAPQLEPTATSCEPDELPKAEEPPGAEEPPAAPASAPEADPKTAATPMDTTPSSGLDKTAESPDKNKG